MFVIQHTFCVFATSASSTITSISTSSLRNGSPLLNGHITSEQEITKESHIALSEYMGTLLVPFFDNYESAFNESATYGSKGQYLNKVRFKVNDDEQNLITDYIAGIAGAASTGIYNKETGEITENHIIYKSDIDIGANYDKDTQYPVAQITDFVTFITNDHYVNSRMDFSFVKDDPNSCYFIIKDNKAIKIWDGSEKCEFVKVLIQHIAGLNKTNKSETISFTESAKIYLDNFANICIGYKNDNGFHNRIIIPASYNPCINSDFINPLSIQILNLIRDNQINIEVLDAKKSKTNNNINNASYLRFKFKADQGLFKWLADLFPDAQKDISKNNILLQYWEMEDVKEKPRDIFSNQNGELKVVWSDNNSSLNTYQITSNQNAFLTYLILAHGSYGDGKTINSEAFLFNKEQIDQLLEKITGMTQDEKKEFALNSVVEFFTTPASFIARILNGLWKLLYNTCSDFNSAQQGQNSSFLGTTEIKNLPFAKIILDFITNNGGWLLAIILTLCILGIIFGKQGITKQILLFFLISFIVLTLDKWYDTISDAFNNTITTLYKSNEASWLWDFNTQWQSHIKDATAIEAMSQSKNDYNTGNNLRYKQDKSPIILNNTSNVIMSVLKNDGFGYLLFDSLVKQYRQGSSISSNIEEMFKRLCLLNFMDYQQYGDTIDNENNYFFNMFEDKINSQTLTSNQANYAERNNTAKNAPYQSYTSRYEGADNWIPYMYAPISVSKDDGTYYLFTCGQMANNKTEPLKTGELHKNFYILDRPLTTTNNKFSSHQEIKADKVAYEAFYSKYFGSADDVAINKFNYYDERRKYDSNYGYFLLTENIIPYFYAVYRDTFLETTTPDAIAQAIQGTLDYGNGNNNLYQNSTSGQSAITPDSTNDLMTEQDFNNLEPEKITLNNETIAKRRSVFMEDSKLIDYADLRELFVNVIPYCYMTSLGAREALDPQFITEKEYSIYEYNRKSWLFDCHWAIKLMQTYYNNRTDGFQFINDSSRFSEYEILGNSGNILNINNVDTTYFENLCLEFYANLTPKLELLIDRINDEGTTCSALIRQMAIITAMEFNKTFSSAQNPVYPQNLDIGSVSIDTIIKDILRRHGLRINTNLSAVDNLSTKINNGKGIQVGFVSFTLALNSLVMMLLSVIKLWVMLAFVLLSYICLGFCAIGNDEAKLWKILAGCLIHWCLILASYFLPVLICLAFSSNEFTSDLSLTIEVFCIILSSCIGGFLALKLVATGWTELSQGKPNMGLDKTVEYVTSGAKNVLNSIKGLGGAVPGAVSGLVNWGTGAAIGIGGFAAGSAYTKLMGDQQKYLEGIKAGMTDEQAKKYSKTITNRASMSQMSRSVKAQQDKQNIINESILATTNYIKK